MADILPDSRLKDPKGIVMCDWPMGNGKTVRLCMEPIFCFNCGKPNGYVPQHIMSFVSWLCLDCSVTWGKEASLHSSADEEFWKAVENEMVAKFGKGLTQKELSDLAEHGKLGKPLELLEKESPYKVWKG